MKNKSPVFYLESFGKECGPAIWGRNIFLSKIGFLPHLDIFSWFTVYTNAYYENREIILERIFGKVRFFKERTWKNQFIQTFAKMALPLSCELKGLFLQTFGFIDFTSTF